MCRGGVTQGKLRRIVSVKLRPASGNLLLFTTFNTDKVELFMHWKMEKKFQHASAIYDMQNQPVNYIFVIV